MGRIGRTKFYAVARGTTPGVYKTWREAQIQVKGFPSALYQSFCTEKEANDFIRRSQDVIPTKDIKIVLGTLERSLVNTDGSASGGVGGYGVVIKDAGQDVKREFSGFVPGEKITNNQAELFAIAVAIDNTTGPTVIVTDSDYSIDAIVVRSKEYNKRGWVDERGQPISNSNYISYICNKCKNRDVRFSHVKGHSGDPDNERADKLAKEGCRSYYKHNPIVVSQARVC